jgi:hypothetical protein
MSMRVHQLLFGVTPGRTRRQALGVGLGMLWLLWVTMPAWALDSARDHLQRGYDQLLQARRLTPGEERDQVLANVVKAFNKAYEIAGRQTKIQTLNGAAQAYLLMQRAPVQFPFLWSASPLSRAQKNLQYVLALEPDNAVAHLLMGLLFGQQAQTDYPKRAAHRQRSDMHWRRAAQLGLPLQPPSSDTGESDLRPPSAAMPPFAIHDVILALQQVDTEGTGRWQDVLLIYRPAVEADRCYGWVMRSHRVYPLMTNRATGVLAPVGRLDALRIDADAAGWPRISVTWQHRDRPVETQFVWDGDGFAATTDDANGS